MESPGHVWSRLRAESDLRLPDALVGWRASAHPVVSVYADWEVSGRGLHEAQTTIRKQLHEVEASLLRRGEAHDSFVADEARIREYLAEEAPPSVRGLAIFACHARGLWMPLSLALPLPTRAYVAEHPALLSLAEATQDAPRAIVAMAATTRLRLVLLDPTGVRELHGVDADSWGSARIGSKTGWRRGHVQRAHETELERHAHDAAAAIGQAMSDAGTRRLALAGEPEVTAHILRALPETVRGHVVGAERMEMRTTAEAVAHEVWPLVAAVAKSERDAEVAELASRAEGDLDASSEPRRVQELASAGLVDTLALDPARLSGEVAELLLREVLTHRARLFIARDHPALAEHGMVASLRFASGRDGSP
jgi:hypothetical protein